MCTQSAPVGTAYSNINGRRIYWYLLPAFPLQTLRVPFRPVYDMAQLFI